MNRPIKNALLTLIMVIVSAAMVYGAAQPLAPSHDYLSTRCGVCHNSPDAASMAKNNVCLVCHKSGSVARTNKQFFIGDMANPFGTTIESVEKATYTHSSHEWSATDDNPAAGALPPVAPIMNQIFLHTGYLSCNRCHSMHLDPPLPHMTKQSMTNDQLCLDCHRLRNTSSHVYGTHPVNVDYNTAVANNPSRFEATPKNSNPSNPTSQLNLINGKVMCSTCHTVHFTDSSSKTLDNFSTAMVGGLVPSKGYLLKTDYRYVNYTTHNSPNICTNCHKVKHEHNGGGQRVLCTDCHSGHVDYDVNATDAASMVPNVYMIKRYMNWSSPTGWKDNKTAHKQTFFQNATLKPYKRADGKGVCQSCHDVPAGGTIAPSGNPYPGRHDKVDANASDCVGCHTHEGTWSFSSSCLNCHGQPPTATSAAPGYTGNEAISGHNKHSVIYSYKCLECHYNGAPDTLHQNNNSFQDVYHRPEYVDAGTIASLYGSTPTYNAGVNTCSNVYCHSNGNPAGGSLVYKNPPNWFGGTTDCNSCHEAAPTTNAHGAHLAKGYVCQNCHAATASGSNAIANKANHADGIKQVEFASVAQPFALSGNNCGNIYCHSDGSGNHSNPDWRNPATGQCGTCHDTLTRTSGAHQPHISASYNYGPKLAAYYNNDAPSVCETCHGPNFQTKHLNGTTVDVDSGRCSISCHANGLGSAVWGGGRTGITCESCHTGTLSTIDGAQAPDKTLAATRGHNMNSSSTGVIMNYNCTSCHDANAKHIDPAVHDTRLLPAYIGATNTECNACHNNTTTVPTLSKSQMFTHVTAYIGTSASANTAPSACATCHDPHGTGNRNMIVAKIVAKDGFNNVTCNISYKNSTSCVSDVKVGNVYTGLCQVCHTGTKYYKNTVQETVHNVGTNCFTCHKHKHESKVYAFQPFGGCDGCHGYPPVQTMQVDYRTMGNYTGARLQNYSGGGGVHDVPGHIPSSASPDQTWSNCLNCHYGSDTSSAHTKGDLTKPSNINVRVNPKFKFDGRRPINYKGNKVDDPAAYSSGTCSNVSCHFQPSPKWSSQK